jgi:hypothetical protein
MPTRSATIGPVDRCTDRGGIAAPRRHVARRFGDLTLRVDILSFYNKLLPIDDQLTTP